MKLDEFSFFNQQLASMLRNGIPLESALGQLCTSMRRGDLRDELEKLRADLANGVPLSQAVAARKLPPFYVQMLIVGATSNDLPAILTLVADYYQRSNLIWTRLKGLLAYPLIVLVASFCLSVFVAVVFGMMLSTTYRDLLEGRAVPTATVLGVFAPVIFLGVVVAAVLVLLARKGWRNRLAWQVTPFKEALLWQVASAMAVMIRGGCHLDEALGLLQGMESDSPAGTELAQWRQRLASGRSRFEEIAGGGRAFPPLFVWLVAESGDDLGAGFERASEMFLSRATNRMEALLNAALPVSMLFLGLVIAGQITMLFLPLVRVISYLGN
jgi:type II secretory pathway component PulF